MSEFLEIQNSEEARARFLIPTLIKNMGEMNLLPVMRSRNTSDKDPAEVFGVAPDGSEPVTLAELANKELTAEQYQMLSLLFNKIDGDRRVPTDLIYVSGRLDGLDDFDDDGFFVVDWDDEDYDEEEDDEEDEDDDE